MDYTTGEYDSRIEILLRDINGESLPYGIPLSRIEQDLQKKLGEDYDLAPIMSRIEELIAYILETIGEPSYPMSRIEKILRNYISGDVEVENPQSRVEELLMEILDEKVVEELVSGTGYVTLTSVSKRGLISLTQFGKCEQASTPTPSVPVDIKCNNGTLKMVDDELPTGYKRVLGFKMNNNSYWEIADFPLYGSDTLRFSFDATDACNVLGAYSGSASGNNYSLYVSTNSNYLRYKNGAYNSAIDYNKRYDVELAPTGSSGMKVDSTWTAQTFTTPLTAASPLPTARNTPLP